MPASENHIQPGDLVEWMPILGAPAQEAMPGLRGRIALVVATHSGYLDDGQAKALIIVDEQRKVVWQKQLRLITGNEQDHE